MGHLISKLGILIYSPLLKIDKQKSIEIFGSYIHTYKFDEVVGNPAVIRKIELQMEPVHCYKYAMNLPEKVEGPV